MTLTFGTHKALILLTASTNVYIINNIVSEKYIILTFFPIQKHRGPKYDTAVK